MLIVAIVILVGGFVAFGLYLYLFQDRFVFYPTRQIEATPTDIGLDYREILIEVANGEQVHAWYVPAPAGTSGEGGTGNRPVVIFCHGNGGNISHRLETIACLARLGANVLFFDYRGYGRSGGSPSEANVYADAEACYRWLVDEGHARPDRIVWFGRSLGGAVAVEMASRTECAGLIVESSFSSARAMGRRMFPFLPVRLLLRYKFDSIDKIGRVKCPVLITHSRDDELVPYRMGCELFERAAEPKSFFELAGGHEDRGYLQSEAYLEQIRWLLSAAR